MARNQELTNFTPHPDPFRSVAASVCERACAYVWMCNIEGYGGSYMYTAAESMTYRTPLRRGA